MIYVSMPTYNTPPGLLERAVESVLGQTGVDLHLVVVGDGCKVSLPADPRMTVFELPHNRGRYFADAVVLEALPDDAWWAPHDSDDWSEPDRFASLQENVRDQTAIVASYWRHEIGRSRRPRLVTPNLNRPTGGYRHIATWASGMYRVDRARVSGGLLPDVRLAYDTLFVQMVQLTGGIAVDRTAKFHWCRRSGSLSSSPKTGMQSSTRQQIKFRLRTIYREAYETKASDLRPLVRKRIDPKIRDEMDHMARVLRETLF